MSQPTPRFALRRHRLQRTSVLGLGLLLALTACNGAEPTPTDTSPTTTASPAREAAASSTGPAADASSSASPGEHAYVPASAEGPAKNVPKPVMPDAMKQETDEGAEAAVKYWFETSHYLEQTNDPTFLTEVSTSECVICKSFPESIDSIYSKGGWHQGNKPHVASTLFAEIEKRPTVTALVDFQDGLQYSSNHKPLSSEGLSVVKKQPWTFTLEFDNEHGYWRVADARAEETQR